jgi:CHAD domain-containing protein
MGSDHIMAVSTQEPQHAPRDPEPGAGPPARRHRPRASQPALTPGATAGEAVLAYLSEQVQALHRLDPLVREDAPDSVHKMRVATRRLRSTLRTFGGVVRPSGTNGLARELAWLAGVLGGARDAEVLGGHLRAALHQLPVEQNIGPAAARVQGHFAAERGAALRRVIAALDSSRYFALLDRLDWLISDPPFTPAAARPASDVLPAAAGRAYRQTRKRLRRAWQAPPGHPREAALHQARKSAKRARYAGEALTPVLGRKAAKFTKRIKRVQSVLGDHQDTVMARPVLRQLAISAHLAGENSYTYGLLYGHDERAAELLQAKARRAWRRAHPLRA